MSKLENQARLVTALKAFTGSLPSCYANETEFFLVSLQSMGEYLEDLQKETLDEVCGSFLRKLDAGQVTVRVIDDFKAVVDRLVTPADFRLAGASMAGSKELVRQRLSALKPVSLLSEVKKVSGRDPEAERQVNGVYSRLNFPALANSVEAAPGDSSANAALARAREEVTEYCSLYRIQMNAADTLTPFSLSCVDAALAAGYLLFRNIRKALDRA